MSSSQEKKDREEEESSIQKAKRVAIVAGINEYQEKDEIPTLAGAENDATELRKILTTNNNFKVLDDHFLIGENASRTAILRAISDVIHHAVEAELVLFYFSGHGILDEKNEGYIAPYDMYAKDPFVSGIKMDDLRQTIERPGRKTSVATILDCCYAGIIAKGTKDVENKKNLQSVYKDNLVQKLYQPGAIYILASSEADKKAREINDCVHTHNSKPHPHGAFSFHLIEGLAGAAANEVGMITFRSLKDHIAKKMKDDGKQYPIFTETETGAFEEISLAIRDQVFNEYMSGVITEARRLITKEEGSSLVNIRNLDDAVKIVGELYKKAPNNTELPKLKEEIDKRFYEHKEALLDWLSVNEWEAAREVNNINPGLYNRFGDIAFELSYEGFQKLNELDKRYILKLGLECERRTEYKSPQEEGLRKLVRALEAIKRKDNLISPQVADK